MSDVKKIHYLHIGKCAGTIFHEVAKAVNQANVGVEIIKHGHDVGLKHIAFGEPYVFAIRSPHTRFVSGFYSRKRKGQPRILTPYTKYEELAFAEFEHANELAEALFAKSKRGKKAVQAIKSIIHTSMNQVDWFDRCGFFLENNPPIHIIRQENFEEDCRNFFVKIGVDLQGEFPNDPVSTHKNDYTDIPELSDKALKNLYAWYRQDYELINLCNHWLEEQDDTSKKPNK